MVLDPVDYRLKPDALERIDLQRYILAESNCETLLRDLGRDLLGTLSKVRDKVPDSEVKERIVISKTVSEALEPAFRPAGNRRDQRQGKVHAFQRSGGRPVLPGSSLKGCLRTAWLAECARRKGLSPGTFPGGPSKKRHERLVKAAFELASHSDTGRDPFRDVTVMDALLPDGATRVDMVSSWKHDRATQAYGLNPSGNILMMRERLRAVIDGGEPPAVPVQIGLRCNHVRKRRETSNRKKDVQPGRVPGTVSALLLALEAHHAPLWKREMEKFFSEKGQGLSQALTHFDDLPRCGENPKAALVRIGWAAHAESKSIAGFREIHRPQARGKEKPAKEGNTRHVIDLPGGPAPFGWALLVREDAWDARNHGTWLPVEPTMPRGRSSPEPMFQKGQHVRLNDGSTGILLENIHENQKEAMMDIDGNPEPVQISDIEGRA